MQSGVLAAALLLYRTCGFNIGARGGGLRQHVMRLRMRVQMVMRVIRMVVVMRCYPVVMVSVRMLPVCLRRGRLRLLERHVHFNVIMLTRVGTRLGLHLRHHLVVVLRLLLLTGRLLAARLLLLVLLVLLHLRVLYGQLSMV